MGSKLKTLLSVLLMFPIAALSTACSEAKGQNKAGDETKKKEFYVSAAASLTDCMTELGDRFTAENQEAEIFFNFASSGKLQQQIEQGAPADLFISAGQKQMDALEEQNLIDKGSRRDLLKNEVVLIVPLHSDLDLQSFEDVEKEAVKMIAIGESSVPAGQYTEEIYRHLGLWEVVQAKANYAQDVRNVLAWVEEDQADCGVVYATDAAISDKVKVAAKAPEGSHQPVIYPAAITAEAEERELAERFLAFIQSDEAAQVFADYGFVTVK